MLAAVPGLDRAHVRLRRRQVDEQLLDAIKTTHLHAGYWRGRGTHSHAARVRSSPRFCKIL